MSRCPSISAMQKVTIRSSRAPWAFSRRPPLIDPTNISNCLQHSAFALNTRPAPDGIMKAGLKGHGRCWCILVCMRVSSAELKHIGLLFERSPDCADDPLRRVFDLHLAIQVLTQALLDQPGAESPPAGLGHWRAVFFPPSKS